MESINATKECAKLKIPILYSTFNVSEVSPSFSRIFVLYGGPGT